MQSLAIVVLSVGAAVVYGILHDQVTARVCVEYFTIGHPPVFPTDSPTLLGLGWGIIATWWVGLPLGVLLAVAARGGERPQRNARSLFRPILALLVVMAACAALAGTAGWVLAGRGDLVLQGPLAGAVPRDRHARFLADACAHLTSYSVGGVGGLVVVFLVWRSRGRADRVASGETPSRPAGSA